MKLVFIYILPVIMFIFYSCEEPTTIDTDQAPPQVIIEGLITNELKRHTIKVTQTANFYDTGNTPRVNGATVIVRDNANNQYNFEEEESGVYRPNQPFQGEIGRTYDLSVLIEGEEYTASERLLPVTTVDSVTYSLNIEETEEVNEDVFSFFLYTVEPQDEKNYYLFKFYRNGTWLNEEGEDITVTDDTAVGEEIDGIEAPYLYLRGDTARVEMYSLTRDAFIFWNDVATLIFSDGGVFAPLPANPRSNISGGALGVFQVSAVDAGEIVIE